MVEHSLVVLLDSSFARATKNPPSGGPARRLSSNARKLAGGLVGDLLLALLDEQWMLHGLLPNSLEREYQQGRITSMSI